VSEETEITIHPPIRIAFSGDRCGDFCKGRDELYDACSLFSTPLEGYTGRTDWRRLRCQACLDAENNEAPNKEE